MSLSFTSCCQKSKKQNMSIGESCYSFRKDANLIKKIIIKNKYGKCAKKKKYAAENQNKYMTSKCCKCKNDAKSKTNLTEKA